MKKLIAGILDFRKRILPEKRALFAELAKGQRPDTLLITCSDSRVAPNWFASTDPGDLFVVRNVGNLVSPCGGNGKGMGDDSVLAAVEFAIQALNVCHIVVCGHSCCGAMHAIHTGATLDESAHLKSWLKNGAQALKTLQSGVTLDSNLSPVDQLSQLNVLQQLENLKTYSLVRNALDEGRLQLHGWWFNIATADVLAYRPEESSFHVIGESWVPDFLHIQ